MKATFLWRGIWFSMFLIAVFIYAQDPVSIAGKVTDAKGVAVPGATVRLAAGDQAPVEFLSDFDGTFSFRGLGPGQYKLTVEMLGFQSATRGGVDSGAEASRSLTIVLAATPKPERAAVPAAAAAGTQPAQTTSFQTIATTDLPGLQLFQDTTQAGSTAVARNDNLILINGNTASLDGGDMNNAGFRNQMMDAARQMGFQLESMPIDGRGGEGGRFGGLGGGDNAAFGGGRGAGGRGGGGFRMGGLMGRGATFKQPVIQGSVSENFSSSALNARSYSLTGQTLPKPVHIGNNFNVTVGGVLPFIRPSTNNARGGGGRGGGRGGGGQPGWTFTYSGSRNRSVQDVLTTVPTALERAGDFSQTYVQTTGIDPATGQKAVTVQPVRLYRVATDPSSIFTAIHSIDPISAGLLAFIPGENIPCVPGQVCVNNYAYQRSLPSSSDQIQAAISGIRLTSKDNVAVNYSMRRGNSLNSGFFPGLDSTRSNSAQNIGISGNHMFKTRLSANWRITLNRTRTEGTNAFAYTQDVEGALGIQGVSREPINWGPPTINFTNYGDLSLAAPSLNRNQTFSISGGLNKMGTKHSLQFGGGVSWNQRNTRSDSNPRGSYSFTAYSTAGRDASGRQIAGTGNDFADFLLSLPYSTSRRYFDPVSNPYGSNTYLRNQSFSLYAQDNWRVRSTLTASLGVRYEYNGPTFEKYDRLVSLDVAPDLSSVAQVFPGEKGPLSGFQFPRSLVSAKLFNLAPRIGIAWRPSARSRFVIRTGYGLFYNSSGYDSIVGQLVGQAPFSVTQNLLSDPLNPLSIKVGFPYDPNLAILNTYAIDPYYRPGYVQQWNFDVQMQLSQLYVLTATYMGSRGTGLDVQRAPNPTSNSSNFIFQTNGGNSIFHGMNVGLARRFSHGLSVNNSYALGKSIDDISSGVAQNDANLRAERALSSQDQRHNFQTSFTYELPIGQNRRFFAASSARLLNFIAGWNFTGSYNVASGSHLTARYTSSGGASGSALYSSLRADSTGISSRIPWGDRTRLEYFNTAAFAIPAGAYGNAGRNTITGPGANMFNLAIHKNFRVDENNRRLDFSCNVSNFLNHPNWGGVSTTINALNFGQVTSVRGMRSMTFNARFNF